MKSYTLVHTPSGQKVAEVTRVDSWWAKGWGVLGRRELLPSTGLWLPGVASVHTLFVQFPMDLLFLDAEFRALKIAHNVPPGRWLVRAAGAHHVIELGAGTIAQKAVGAKPGDLWKCV